MAEVKNDEEESVSHAKRKPNLNSVEKDEEPKKPKLEASDKDSSFVEEKINKDGADEDNDKEDDEEDYEDDDDDDEDDEEEEDGGHSNGKVEVDRKGKGILRVDKGKGKLIEEDGSDDDSSNGDGEGESDGDSDLSDDPLAEVDLDNILPSRTRRRAVNPGVYIANDIGNDDDDSDDSDARGD